MQNALKWHTSLQYAQKINPASGEKREKKKTDLCATTTHERISVIKNESLVMGLKERYTLKM